MIRHAHCIHLSNCSRFFLVLESNFHMLSFVYHPSFSGSLDPHPSLSLSTAASVYARRVWLLPTLATRGAGNASKVAIADTNCMRLDTNTMNTEHMRNVIS